MGDAIRRFAGGGRRRIAQSADLVVERGEGPFLYGAGGRRYLDAVSGYGVASLGHSHPRWVEAVVAQAGRLAVTPLDTEELARYLSALAGVLPSHLDRVALFSGGAEAVEVALRLAQTASGKPGVLAFRDSFHGKTAAVRYSGDPTAAEGEALGVDWMRTACFPACRQHDAVSYPSCEESAEISLSALAERDDLEDVGVVVIEPILGTAGNIPPQRRFLQGLRRFCDERGWLLVLDESITGFGRLGTLFGFEYFDVEADVVVLGKGLGGGFPLSAVCACAQLWERSALGVPSGTSSSYGGNPLACAAGLATLEIVTSDSFLPRVREVAAHAAVRLRQLAERSAEVARPRGVGLMLGFDLVQSESDTLVERERCLAIFRECRDRGLLLAADVPRVRISPPLTLGLEEADQMFDVLEEVLG
ncbi:MAG: class-III pyridoxal-phosphate-dependent aminotransferase [Solirubrobacterales bacterium]